MHEPAQSVPQARLQGEEASKGPKAEQPSCPGCGRAAEAGHLFCPQCGRPLSQPKPPAASGGGAQAADGPVSSPPQGADSSDNSKTSPPQLPLVGPNAPAESTPKAQACACGQNLIEGAQFCHCCGARIGEVMPSYRLVGVSPGIEGLLVRIAGEELTIGKAADCDVAIPGDDYASRRHARVFRSQGMFFLEDLGSANGTFLRVRRPIALDVGDEIAIGTSVIRLMDANGGKPRTEDSECPD